MNKKSVVPTLAIHPAQSDPSPARRNTEVSAQITLSVFYFNRSGCRISKGRVSFYSAHAYKYRDLSDTFRGMLYGYPIGDHSLHRR